ncbi:MAG: hypothetical protein O3C40_09655 [Planctomycetota bacterium]|nr:hypothetical protein [Planctomycetota bacterium]
MNDGLDRGVSVVVWGEFGRTPTIPDLTGRPQYVADVQQPIAELV